MVCTSPCGGVLSCFQQFLQWIILEIHHSAHVKCEKASQKQDWWAKGCISQGPSRKQHIQVRMIWGRF